MKPNFSDIKLNSAAQQTAAASKNKDVWLPKSRGG